jgi:opacity protein-like surface antigen
MRSVKYLVVAGAASLLSSAVFAADLPIMSPPQQQYYAPPPQDFGGWYLRGDIGMTNSSGKLHDDLFDTLPAGSTLTHMGEGFTGGTLYDIGVGYQFNSWFRADITGEYRSRVGFSGTDFSTFPGGSTLSDVYQGGYTSWVGLANIYVDLGTWWCLTPFVGAGVGAAHITTTGLQDSGLVFAPGLGSGNPSSYFANGASTTNFAWALHAGVAYRVTNNFTVELAYRYLDLGTAVTGSSNFAFSSPGVLGTHAWTVNNPQDVKLGVRWTCCDVPPPPPPLVTKG